MISWLQHFVEYIEGARDDAPSGLKLPLSSPLWGLWWTFLLALIVTFSGQASKFIYIDF